MNDPLIPLLSLVAAFAVVALSGPPVISLLRRLKFGQPIRGEGPQSHLVKQGTPTMGGVLIWIGAIVGAIPAYRHPDMRALLLLFIGYGLIGFADDLVKVVFRNTRGVPARVRLVLQLLFAAVFLYFISRGGAVQIWSQTGFAVPGYLYIILGTLVLAGTANAVNFTDGVDGLLSTALLPTLGFFVVIGAGFAEGALLLAVAGALLGFLLYNRHPAKVFMGDTGSLALGALIAGLFFVYPDMLPFMPLVCALYWVEMLSVIIQVASFKTRKVRVFKMAPIHHHFELSGWSEGRIVAVFSGVSLACAVLGVLLYALVTGTPLW